MEIVFHASIEGAGVLRFDSDGAGILRLAIPATELAEAAKLLTCREKPLTVRIQVEEDPS